MRSYPQPEFSRAILMMRGSISGVMGDGPDRRDVGEPSKPAVPGHDGIRERDGGDQPIGPCGQAACRSQPESGAPDRRGANA
jgi:hypothetical protein